MLNKPIVTNTAELDIEFSAGTMINYQTWTTVLDCDLRLRRKSEMLEWDKGKHKL